MTNMLVENVALTQVLGPSKIFSLFEAPIQNLTIRNVSWTHRASLSDGIYGAENGGANYVCEGWNGTKIVEGLFATGSSVDLSPPLPRDCIFLGPTSPLKTDDATGAQSGGYHLTSATGDCNSAGCIGSLSALEDDGLYGAPIPKLKLQAMAETTSRLHLKLTDADSPCWEPPGILRQPETEWQQLGTGLDLLERQTTPAGDDGSFGFAVTRSGAARCALQVQWAGV